jgi:hypothetical protein
MTRLTYPSTQFPAGPRVRLEVPEGWQALPVPGALVAAIRPEPADVFNPNIVVTSEPQAPGFELTSVLEVLEQTARERREGTVGEPYATRLSGYEFIGRPLSWIDDQAGTVVQLHLFGLVPRTPVDTDPDRAATDGAAAAEDSGLEVDLVHVTGTVGAADGAQDYALVRDIVGTLRVAPWTGSIEGSAP